MHCILIKPGGLGTRHAQYDTHGRSTMANPDHKEKALFFVPLVDPEYDGIPVSINSAPFSPKPLSESADEGGGQAPRGSASSTQDVPNVNGESTQGINIRSTPPVPPVLGQADVIQQILLSLQKLGQQVGSLQQRQDELARKETSSSSPTSIDLGTPGASRALVSSAAQHSEQELNVLSSPSPLLAFDSTSKQQADSTGDIPEFVGQDTKKPTCEECRVPLEPFLSF